MSFPQDPLLLFDGDCGVCRFWAERWRLQSAGRLDIRSSQEAGGLAPHVPPERFAESVVLVEPDGATSQGARAVFRALALGTGSRLPWLAYRCVPGFAAVTELGYRFVAANRGLLAGLTRLLWGRNPALDTFAASTALFLRAVGLVFLVAFLSLWTQVHGLVGSQGILPVAPWLEAVAANLGAERFWHVPTLLWLGAGDAALHVVCGAGVLLSLLLLLGLLPGPCLVLLWALYLSLIVAGRTFLNFQWDALLLETALHAALLAPLALRSRLRAPRAPAAIARWLAWWLLFRLVFLSGVVKLASGDPSWRDFTAMAFHHETQPLPTPLAWFLHQLPTWAHRASTIATFGVELVLPFFIFLPRRPRRLAAAAFLGLQVAITASGNYGCFNLLTAALCLLLIDDGAWPAWLRPAPSAAQPAASARRLPRAVLIPLAAAIVVVTTCAAVVRIERHGAPPAVAVAIARAVAPLRTLNAYGLFAVMTKSRPELRIEGSNDGEAWTAYDFRYKPGDPQRAPRTMQPHMPRLDWLAWFASLGPARQSPWVASLCHALLVGSPDVLGLLARDPFDGTPPRWVRVVVQDYRFTTKGERVATGAWWVAGPARPWLGPLTLQDFDRP